MKETKIWVVLNEENLTTLKDSKGQVVKFESEKQADSYASTRLNMWIAVKVWFNHHWLHHEPSNLEPEVYFQPELTGSNEEMYSFQVYSSYEAAKSDYPDRKIIAYSGNDIEDYEIIG